MHLRSRLLWGGVALLMICAACTSPGSGGDDDVLGDDDTPPGETFTVAYADGAGPWTPGEVVAIVTTGAPADGDFAAAIDELPVTLAEDAEGALSFLMPPVVPGSRTLTVTRATAIGTLAIEVGTYPAIDAPEELVTQRASEIDGSLATIAASLEDPADQALIAGWRDDLATALEGFDTLTPDEQALVAYAIQSIDMASGETLPQKLGAVECPHTDPMLNALGKMFAGGLLFATSWGAGPFGAIVGGIGLAAWIVYGNEALDHAIAMMTNCRLVSELTWTSFAAGPSMFEHDVSKTAAVSTTWSLFDDAKSALARLKSTFFAKASFLPAAWIAEVESFQDTTTEPGPPADLVISNVASPTYAIAGELQKSATSVTLRFRFVNAQRQAPVPVSFTYELQSSEGGGPFTDTVSATLAPKCLDGDMLCPDQGGCMQVLDDRHNCGTCGNTCASNEGCIDGACVAP